MCRVGGGGAPGGRRGGSSVFEPLVRGGSFDFHLPMGVPHAFIQKRNYVRSNPNHFNFVKAKILSQKQIRQNKPLNTIVTATSSHVLKKNDTPKLFLTNYFSKSHIFIIHASQISLK